MGEQKQNMSRLTEALDPVIGPHVMRHVTLTVSRQAFWPGSYAVYNDLFTVKMTLRAAPLTEGWRPRMPRPTATFERLSRDEVHHLLNAFRYFDPRCHTCGDEEQSPVHLTQSECERLGNEHRRDGPLFRCQKPSEHHPFRPDDTDAEDGSV